MGEDEVKYELQMPFVTCQSVGGPHEDNAYVAGWAMGSLDAKLQFGPREIQFLMLQKDNRQQLDLILMKHGYSFRILDRPVDMLEDWDEIVLIPNDVY
jgi:hypothetical protein